MDKDLDPKQEGHTREWQDRARVVLNAKEDVKHNASQNQSPESDEEDVEEKSEDLNKKEPGDSNY